MLTTSKAAIMSAALLAVVFAPTNLSAQQSLRERLAAAVQAVEAACAADVSKFCGNVTRGEGRVLVCMHAHDDQLSRGCQLSLYRASRNLDRALNRVEQIADACWNDIEAQCANADRIGQCVMEKAGSLSPSCQTIVTGLRQAAEGLETRGAR
jgi:Golgi apparatus protein 1